MAHCVVAAAEAILDQEFPVLDKGFVRLVDYMGGDERIVAAARVSYGSGTKSYREDRALIDYLLRNEHTSPFEQVVLTFHAKMPIFVARQWIRHRTARLNEISGRYSVMKDEFFLPRLEDLTLQSRDNKQGRSAQRLGQEHAQTVLESLRDEQKRAYEGYLARLGTGLAREVARINLPLSLYTEWYWQIDLHNLFRFLALRLDAHAQQEIRAYAERMLEIADAVAPAACQSFREHVLGGVRFSAAEFAALREALVAQGGSVRAAAEKNGLRGKSLERFEEKLRSGRRV